MERKLIEACTAHIMAHPSLTQVTPVLFNRSGENCWMRTQSSVVFLLLHLFVLFPACLCVVVVVALLCVVNAWTGALVRSQVTAGRGPHLSPLRSTTMAVVPRR